MPTFSLLNNTLVICLISDLKMNRSKTIVTSFNDMKIHFSTKAKKSKLQNHYDTLSVTPESTQDDIKSAYYELTKKYHPDKNTSEDAKQKFQSISDAYETLSNFHKRKQYDRELLARGEHSKTRKVYKAPENPTSGFQSRQDTRFDFDAWTRAHYGDTLKRSIQDRKDKLDREAYKIMRKQLLAEEKRSDRQILAVFISIILFIFTLQVLFSKDYDQDTVSKKKGSNS